MDIGEDGVNFNFYRIQPHDAMMLAAVPIVLMLAALVAACIPARRAASIDPTHVLRME